MATKTESVEFLIYIHIKVDTFLGNFTIEIFISISLTTAYFISPFNNVNLMNMHA